MELGLCFWNGLSRSKPTYFEWWFIEPLLQNKPWGIPRVYDRLMLNRIFRILKSGLLWRDLLGLYGGHTAC